MQNSLKWCLRCVKPTETTGGTETPDREQTVAAVGTSGRVAVSSLLDCSHDGTGAIKRSVAILRELIPMEVSLASEGNIGAMAAQVSASSLTEIFVVVGSFWGNLRWLFPP